MESTKSRAAILTVALGTFMTCFDINAVNIALPVIQSSLHASLDIVEWVVVAYLLTLCATQLTFGRLSDLYGLKKIYLTGFIGFTVSSLLCGLSGNIGLLIVFRIVEALSGAMMMATGQAIVVNAVSPENRGKALSVTSITVAVASCAGPSLGGLLASAFGWSSIFFINIPIGIVGALLAVRNIPTDAPKTDSKFDPVGSLMIMLSLLLILLPLDLISKMTVSPLLIILSLITGAVLLAVFIVYESKCDHPILNLHLFENRVFAGGNFAATFFYMGEFIMVFLAPYYLQQQRMLSVSVSGLMMLPMSLCMILVAPVSGVVSDRHDSRYISCVGLLILSGIILFFGTFGAHTPIALLVAAFAVTGIGAGLFHTPNNSVVMGSAPAVSRGVAGATLGTMRNIGMVLGEAVAAALLSNVSNHAAQAYAAQGISGTLLREESFSSAVHVICAVAACCALAALVLSLIRGKAKKSMTVSLETAE